MYNLPHELESKKDLLKNMVNILLYYLPRGIPDFTDHGERHSKRIEEMLNESIIPACNNSENPEIHLNDYECFCMIVSCWLHDIGCIISRNNHGLTSAKIVEDLLGEVFTAYGIEGLKSCITKIISTHTDTDDDKENGKLSISDLIEEIDVKVIENGTLKTVNIKIRLIASLFRLADACDICANRAPSIVYKLIKETMNEEISKEFWLAHAEITKISINPEEHTFIIRVDNKNRAKKVTDKFRKDIEEIEQILNELKFTYTNVKVLEMGGPDWK